MNITPHQFNKKNLNQRGELVFQHGKYLGVRSYYNQKLNLYSLSDFFVEVWYAPNENRIHKIEVLDDLKALDRYIDYMNSLDKK